MKKIVLLSVMVILMCCAGMVKAQRPVGDTLRIPPEDYFCDQYNNLQPVSSGDTLWSVPSYTVLVLDRLYQHGLYPVDSIDSVRVSEFHGNYILGKQMLTNRPLKIVGIAACAFRQNPADTTVSRRLAHLPPYPNPEIRAACCFLNTRDTDVTHRVTDSLILFKPEGKNMRRLASSPWRIEQPHRNMVLPPIYPYYKSLFFPHYDTPIHVYELHPWSLYDTAPVAALYEVIFDHPVVVEDSFVVAGTALNNDGSYGWECPPEDRQTSNEELVGEIMWLWDYCPTRYWSFFAKQPDTYNPDSCDICWIKYRYDDWYRYASRPRYTPVIFPVFDLNFDTVLCHEVSNLRVAERGAGSATLMWDAGDGGPWIVAYGKVDDAWEDFTFDTVTAPMITLTGLEVGTQYFALVRGYCSVTEEYGEWTRPLEVEIFQPGHEEPEGIEHPGDLGRFTRLVPNPARGEVNVVSSFRLSRIELYSLDGRKVLEQEADGISTMVDVSSLPRGTYIAALYLPHGVATKKLVVEN